MEQKIRSYLARLYPPLLQHDPIVFQQLVDFCVAHRHQFFKQNAQGKLVTLPAFVDTASHYGWHGWYAKKNKHHLKQILTKVPESLLLWQSLKIHPDYKIWIFLIYYAKFFHFPEHPFHVHVEFEVDPSMSATTTIRFMMYCNLVDPSFQIATSTDVFRLHLEKKRVRQPNRDPFLIGGDNERETTITKKLLQIEYPFSDDIQLELSQYRPKLTKSQIARAHKTQLTVFYLLCSRYRVRTIRLAGFEDVISVGYQSYLRSHPEIHEKISRVIRTSFSKFLSEQDLVDSPKRFLQEDVSENHGLFTNTVLKTMPFVRRTQSLSWDSVTNE